MIYFIKFKLIFKSVKITLKLKLQNKKARQNCRAKKSTQTKLNQNL